MASKPEEHASEGGDGKSDKVLSTFSLTPQRRAVNCHNLSFIYNSLGDTDKAIEYMVYAALADLQVATKETAAMFTLAKLLYEHG